MTASPSAPGAREETAPESFEVTVLSPLLRVLASLLWLTLRLGTPALSLWIMVVLDPPAGPALPVVACMLGLASLVGAEVLVRLATAGTARVESGVLVVETRARTHRLAVAALGQIRPWRIPLPGPGLRLAGADGARSALSLGTSDPAALLGALHAEGGEHAAPSIEAAFASPAVAFADARARARERRWLRPESLRFVGRVVVYGLIPTTVFVYTHQMIVWGGFWAELEMYGARAWLTTFARFWLAVSVILLIVSSACRGVSELGCFAATLVAPSLGARARRVAEVAHGVLYYVGVPALTALRYADF